MPRSSTAPKQLGPNSGLTPMSTIEATDYISSLHNKPSFPANLSEASSRVQNSNMSVSKSRQQLQFPQQNIHQPSINLFTGPNSHSSHIKQQPYITTAWLQSAHESTSAKKMGNLGTASISQYTQPCLQSSVPEMQQQLPQLQNAVSNVLQRPWELHNHAFRLPMQQQQHQQMMGPPNYPNLQAHQNSSDFIAPSVLTNSSDRRDQAYEQLQFLKEAHLANLMKIYKRAEELSLQSVIAERTNAYEKTRLFLEKIVMFLQISKADFFQYSQQNVHQKMKSIMWYIKQLKDRNPRPIQQHQPLQQSGGQLYQYGPLRSATQYTSSWQQEQTSTNNTPQVGSQRTLEHRASSWLPHGSIIREMSNSNFGQTSLQRMAQQHHLIGQPIEHSSQKWVPSSISQNHIASPQVSHPPSPPVEVMGSSATVAYLPVLPQALYPNNSSLHNNNT